MAATSYSRANYTVFNTGDSLSTLDQDGYAQYLSNEIRNGHSSLTTECSNAIQRLSCLKTFPECPVAGTSISGIAYFKPCKIQCLQVNARCHPNIHINCDGYPDIDCGVYAPSGYFILSPTQGPYDRLPTIYGLCLFFWLIMAIGWNYLTYIKYRNSCVLLCRAISGIPVIKVIVLIFGTSFWGTCVSWQMCSFWMGVSLINSHLVYETGQMIVFLLVAKGWTITRETLAAAEWRNIIMIMSAFYMSNSIILVLESSLLSGRGVWLANGLLYGIMYLYILESVGVQLYTLKRQVSMLGPDMPVDIITPLKRKYKTYILFTLLVFVSISIEVIAHGLLRYGKMWIVLLVYEVSNVMILFGVGWLFQPQEYSPFFFMVPAVMTDTGNKPIPILEADDSANDIAEVELQRLVESDNVVFAPSKMIIIRNPNDIISVGINASSSSSSENGRFGLTSSGRRDYRPLSNADDEI